MEQERRCGCRLPVVQWAVWMGSRCGGRAGSRDREGTFIICCVYIFRKRTKDRLSEVSQNSSPVVKWLSHLTLNQVSQVRILAGEAFLHVPMVLSGLESRWHALPYIQQRNRRGGHRLKSMYDSFSIQRARQRGPWSG